MSSSGGTTTSQLTKEYIEDRLKHWKHQFAKLLESKKTTRVIPTKPLYKVKDIKLLRKELLELISTKDSPFSINLKKQTKISNLISALEELKIDSKLGDDVQDLVEQNKHIYEQMNTHIDRILEQKLNGPTKSSFDFKDYKFESLRTRMDSSIEENQLDDVCEGNDSLECAFKSIRSLYNPELFLNVYPIIKKEHSKINIASSSREIIPKYTRDGENSNYIISVKLEGVFFKNSIHKDWNTEKKKYNLYLNKPILFLEPKKHDCPDDKDDNLNCNELELTNGFQFNDKDEPTHRTINFNNLLARTINDRNEINPNWFSFNYSDKYNDTGAYFKFIKISNEAEYKAEAYLNDIKNKPDDYPFYLIFSTRHTDKCLKLIKNNSELKITFGYCNGSIEERFKCYESEIRTLC